MFDVLPLGAAERERYFNKLPINGEVRREVESLLSFENESESLMNLSAVQFLKDFIDADETNKNSLNGQKIGIYKIVGELGFGGMGAVYLAERADGKFSQKVAVKMLRREYNIERIRRTFRREKDILAALVHPNIARLLDAGKTDDNIPFLVMEYVEGVPVDEFCRAEKLDLTARLKLFNKICDAAAFAHRNLIIHRDLKPSNILVSKNGEPKLLDFGISKLLDDKNETAKNTTLLGAMTPKYASPEQTRGEIVSTATDIYSLGVVLGELVRSPKSEVRSPGNSAGLRKLKSATTNSGKKRLRISDFGLRTSDDLQAILQTATREEAELRYKSVEQFSADIRRFIDGLPVTARPATFSYRANKFVRRNKISVVAGVLIFLSLITGITAAIWQARKANEQARISAESQKRAEAETTRANIEKEKAEKISRFMAKVISYANPAWYAEGAKFGGDVRLIEVLNDLSGKIDTEFADEPDVAAELHHKFTEVYNASREGVTDEARLANIRNKQKFHARRALELRTKFYGAKHELVAKDMYYLFHSKLPETGDAELLARAIEMMRETNTKNLNFPYMLSDYAAYLITPDYQKFHEQFRQAAIPATDNKFRLGEDYSREALRFYRFHYKEDNFAIAQSECNLAYALAKQNKMTDARQHFYICRDLTEKFYFSGNFVFLKQIENVFAENESKTLN